MKKLKILFVEDIPTDVEIAKRALIRENINFSYQVVDSADEFEKALTEFAPDLIISDYSMPTFDGMQALQIIRSQPYYIPFIMLTGSMNEETAVACMKAGADDYVLKEKIRRLPFAVKEVMTKVKAQQEKQESEAQFKAMFENMASASCLDKIVYENGKAADYYILDVNPAYERITGLKREQLIGRKASDLYGTKKVHFLDTFANVAETGEPAEFEAYFPPLDKYLHVTAGSPKKGFFSTVFSDITKKKQAEQKLRKSEQLFRTLFTDAITPIFMVEKSSQTYIDANKAALEFLEYSNNDLIGKSVYTHTPPEILEEEKRIHTNFEQSRTIETQYLINGKLKTLLLEITPLKMADSELLIGIGQDITKRKQAEMKIEENLAEKNLLLRELYHRTKNNMQVVISMLRIQARNSNNPELTEIFNNMYNKIKAMAMVHEKLYKAKDLSYINLKEYINDFLHHLIYSYSHTGTHVTLDLHLEDTMVNIDRAIPLGFVLTELISNIFKHAFPEDPKGNIRIDLISKKPDKLVLKVSDNGVGIGKNINLREIKSMGLKNVFTLVEDQLQGKIDYMSDKGLTWTITIPNTRNQNRI